IHLSPTRAHRSVTDASTLWLDVSRRACALLMMALVSCSAPTKQERMQAAQAALIEEAMDLQRCMNANGYSSDRCISQRDTYERHVAAFRAGIGKQPIRADPLAP